MPASTDIREGLGEAFDVLSEEFLSGVEVTLCKQSATLDEFQPVLEITSKRFFEYSNFRKNFLLEIAEDSDDLTDAMAEATHVKINDDYYVMLTDDTTPPLSTDATWKIYCDRVDRRENFATI